VSVTFDRDGEAKIYLDGMIENTNDISNSVNYNMQANWPFRIGEYSGDGLHFNGAIDEVSFYNRVLTESEINYLYNLTNPPPPIQICNTLYCDDENIGIGTSDTQGYKLAVAGDIITEKVKVATQSNWPDYVFDENYNLQDLQQLEQYIKTHGHLPNIPNAETIKEEGLDLGEMNAKLLEKIEELSLYIIEQGKINRSQDRENQKLKGKIEALEEQNEQLKSINKVYNEKFQILEDRLKELENR